MKDIIVNGIVKNITKEINNTLKLLDPNEDVIVTFSSKRSLAANRYFHNCVRLICDETGETNLERMKRIIKKDLGYYEDIVDEGEKYRIFKSTADMSKTEFNEFILKLEVWAIENCNVYLSTPENINKKINIKLKD